MGDHAAMAEQVIYVIDGGDRFGVAGATTDPAAVVDLLLEADTSFHKAFGLDPCDPTVELAGVADAARQRLEEEEAGATSFGPLWNRWAHFSVRAFRDGRLAP